MYLGRISYGTYLWHWPIIVFTLLITNRRISPVSTFAISALLATALASLSYTLIEQPIRLPRIRPRLNPVVIAVGLTAGIVAALTIVPNILTPSHASDLSESASATLERSGDPAARLRHGAAGGAEDVRGVRFLPSWGCRDEAPTKCTIGPRRPSAHPGDRRQRGADHDRDVRGDGPP